MIQLSRELPEEAGGTAGDRAERSGIGPCDAAERVGITVMTIESGGPPMPELSDEQRMNAAVELAQGQPDDDAQLIRRQGTRRAIVTRIVVTLAAIVGGIFVAMILLSGPENRSDDIPAWREAVSYGASALGIVLVIGTFVRSARRGRVAAGWRSPAFALTGRQRRDLLLQIKGRRPVDPARLPVSRHLATDLVDNGTDVWGMTGVQLIVFGNALRSNWTWMWVLGAVTAALFVIVQLDTSRTLRRARAFLAAHPAATTEPSDD